MLRPIFSTALDGELGIETPSSASYLTYPNPTTGMIFVKSPYGDEQGYLVYTMQGEQIMSFEGEQGDFSTLPNGYYLVQSIKHPEHRVKIIRCD